MCHLLKVSSAAAAVPRRGASVGPSRPARKVRLVDRATISADAVQRADRAWDSTGAGRWPNAERQPLRRGGRAPLARAGRRHGGRWCCCSTAPAAATHSWRDLLPRLAARFTVVAPDLPGHGFTRAPHARRLSLDGMASALARAAPAFGVTPAARRRPLGRGGRAAAARRGRARRARRVVGLNAALAPPPTAYSPSLAPLVRAARRAMARRRAAAWLVAATACPGSLLDSTGSRSPAEQVALYDAFARSPAHARAVLAMMAGWDLDALARRAADDRRAGDARRRRARRVGAAVGAAREIGAPAAERALVTLAGRGAPRPRGATRRRGGDHRSRRLRRSDVARATLEVAASARA